MIFNFFTPFSHKHVKLSESVLSDYCHCVKSHHTDLTLVSTVAHQVTSSSAVFALSAAGVVEAPAGRCSLSTPAGRVTRRPRALLRSDPSAPYPSEREERWWSQYELKYFSSNALKSTSHGFRLLHSHLFSFLLRRNICDYKWNTIENSWASKEKDLSNNMFLWIMQ